MSDFEVCAFKKVSINMLTRKGNTKPVFFVSGFEFFQEELAKQQNIKTKPRKTQSIFSSCLPRCFLVTLNLIPN